MSLTKEFGKSIFLNEAIFLQKKKKQLGKFAIFYIKCSLKLQ